MSIDIGDFNHSTGANEGADGCIDAGGFARRQLSRSPLPVCHVTDGLTLPGTAAPGSDRGRGQSVGQGVGDDR